MFPGARHHQISYVTPDIDKAMSSLGEAYGVHRFHRLDPPPLTADPESEPKVRLALAMVGGLEIELIQPIGGNNQLYSAPLAAAGSPLLLFHHVGLMIDGGREDWDRHRAGIDETRHPVVFEGGIGEDLRFIYTDERARLGHYVELIWMSESFLAGMRDVVPRYP